MKKILIALLIMAIVAVFAMAGYAATQRSMADADRTIERIDAKIRAYEARK